MQTFSRWSLLALALTSLLVVLDSVKTATINIRPECNGRGRIADAHCLCDSRFTGIECAEPRKKDDGQAVFADKTVAMFVDGFNDTGVEAASESNMEIARRFTISGYDVTVFVNSVTEEWVTSEGVRVKPAPAVALDYGQSTAIAASLAVHHHIQKHSYQIVYFEADSGIGYYSLLYRRLGLSCPDSRFIVGVNRQSNLDVILLDSFNHSLSTVHKASAAELLKTDYMRSKSILYADHTLFASITLQQHFDGVVLPFLVDTTQLPKYHDIGPVEEVVYVGEMSRAGGLVTFIDAIDVLHTLVVNKSITLAISKTPSRENASLPTALTILFLGELAEVDQELSVDYLERRTSTWTRFHVEVRLSPLQSKPITSYLTHTPSTLAILPSLGQNNPYLLQSIVTAGVPVLAAGTAQNIELIGKNSVFYESNQNGSLINALTSRLSNNNSSSTAALAFNSSLIASSYVNWMDTIEQQETKCVNLPNITGTISIGILHSSSASMYGLKKTIHSIGLQSYRNVSIVVVLDPKTVNSTNSDTVVTDTNIQSLFDELPNKLNWTVIYAGQPKFIDHLGALVATVTSDHILVLHSSDYVRPDFVNTLVRIAQMSRAPFAKAGIDVSGERNKRYVPIGNGHSTIYLDKGFGELFYGTKVAFNNSLNTPSTIPINDMTDFSIKAAEQGYTIEAIPEPLVWREANLIGSPELIPLTTSDISSYLNARQSDLSDDLAGTAVEAVIPAGTAFDFGTETDIVDVGGPEATISLDDGLDSHMGNNTDLADSTGPYDDIIPTQTSTINSPFENAHHTLARLIQRDVSPTDSVNVDTSSNTLSSADPLPTSSLQATIEAFLTSLLVSTPVSKSEASSLPPSASTSVFASVSTFVPTSTSEVSSLPTLSSIASSVAISTYVPTSASTSVVSSILISTSASTSAALTTSTVASVSTSETSSVPTSVFTSALLPLSASEASSLPTSASPSTSEVSSLPTSASVSTSALLPISTSMALSLPTSIPGSTTPLASESVLTSIPVVTSGSASVFTSESATVSPSTLASVSVPVPTSINLPTSSYIPSSVSLSVTVPTSVDLPSSSYIPSSLSLSASTISIVPTVSSVTDFDTAPLSESILSFATVSLSLTVPTSISTKISATIDPNTAVPISTYISALSLSTSQVSITTNSTITTEKVNSTTSVNIETATLTQVLSVTPIPTSISLFTSSITSTLSLSQISDGTTMTTSLDRSSTSQTKTMSITSVPSSTNPLTINSTTTLSAPVNATTLPTSMTSTISSNSTSILASTTRTTAVPSVSSTVPITSLNRTSTSTFSTIPTENDTLSVITGEKEEFIFSPVDNRTNRVNTSTIIHINRPTIRIRGQYPTLTIHCTDKNATIEINGTDIRIHTDNGKVITIHNPHLVDQLNNNQCRNNSVNSLVDDSSSEPSRTSTSLTFDSNPSIESVTTSTNVSSTNDEGIVASFSTSSESISSGSNNATKTSWIPVASTSTRGTIKYTSTTQSHQPNTSTSTQSRSTKQATTTSLWSTTSIQKTTTPNATISTSTTFRTNGTNSLTTFSSSLLTMSTHSLSAALATITPTSITTHSSTLSAATTSGSSNTTISSISAVTPIISTSATFTAAAKTTANMTTTPTKSVSTTIPSSQT